MPASDFIGVRPKH